MKLTETDLRGGQGAAMCRREGCVDDFERPDTTRRNDEAGWRPGEIPRSDWCRLLQQVPRTTHSVPPARFPPRPDPSRLRWPTRKPKVSNEPDHRRNAARELPRRESCRCPTAIGVRSPMRALGFDAIQHRNVFRTGFGSSGVLNVGIPSINGNCSSSYGLFIS